MNIFKLFGLVTQRDLDNMNQKYNRILGRIRELEPKRKRRPRVIEYKMTAYNADGKPVDFPAKEGQGWG